ncbi:MAG: hypothetical protein R2722_00990 [Tessaracoccus sp.]
MNVDIMKLDVTFAALAAMAEAQLAVAATQENRKPAEALTDEHTAP